MDYHEENKGLGQSRYAPSKNDMLAVEQKNCQQAGHTFQLIDPSTPQGYTFVYLPSPYRMPHSKVRKRLRILGIAQARVLDIHFPTKGIVCLLILVFLTDRIGSDRIIALSASASTNHWATRLLLRCLKTSKVSLEDCVRQVEARNAMLESQVQAMGDVIARQVLTQQQIQPPFAVNQNPEPVAMHGVVEPWRASELVVWQKFLCDTFQMHWTRLQETYSEGEVLLKPDYMSDEETDDEYNGANELLCLLDELKPSSDATRLVKMVGEVRVVALSSDEQRRLEGWIAI
ncbi:hypothetical protein INT45_001391 [Circinella minor]|uniref:Uncharacterized protein n=1 Tax=Circinella minor TaxID=1195481 RepID=A0A8H7VGF0_9FUNG|nr:hypothetical protein INT45_001391 [Circinella minor]